MLGFPHSMPTAIFSRFWINLLPWKTISVRFVYKLQFHLLFFIWNAAVPQKRLHAEREAKCALFRRSHLLLLLFLWKNINCGQVEWDLPETIGSSNQWTSFIDNEPLMMMDVVVSTLLYWLLIRNRRNWSRIKALKSVAEKIVKGFFKCSLSVHNWNLFRIFSNHFHHSSMGSENSFSNWKSLQVASQTASF